MTFDQSVYEYVKSVPRGKVTTYGMIARAIGHPRAARQVGNALHRNPAPGIVPCHRVVNREGRLAPLLRSAESKCRQGSWKKRA